MGSGACTEGVRRRSVGYVNPTRISPSGGILHCAEIFFVTLLELGANQDHEPQIRAAALRALVTKAERLTKEQRFRLGGVLDHVASQISEPWGAELRKVGEMARRKGMVLRMGGT
jgi:hypothetical protein